MAFTLMSLAFDDGYDIPKKYTFDGENVSPPLAWSGVPEGTQSLVLIVDDPDAPDPAAPQRIWTHWLLYNIPPHETSLAEDVKAVDLPPGTKEGLNDWKRTGYGGPRPPIGKHRYFHKLFALDSVLPNLGNATRAEVEKAMQGHVIAQAQTIGLYQQQ
ncbi:MAG: YbhB/YbcL family Raf kinase inhibitor-like protein [Burkholderiaceae bacterium]